MGLSRPHCRGRPLVVRGLLSAFLIQTIPNRPTCAAAVRHGLRRRQHPPRRDLGENLKCDALIVGAGITGSLVAERLTRQGLDVIIVDRELPGRGSTAASTSMLLWEIDRPLRELSEVYGFERASRAYRASLDAVAGLKSLVWRLGIACDMRDKNSLYLAAGESSAESAGRASLAGSAPACPAIFSTMPCCWIALASRVPVRSSRRVRPMPIP